VKREKRILSDEESNKLSEQNSRLVHEVKARKLEVDALKHWDLFYKRNETRFFKDRRWTTREFNELLGLEPRGDVNSNGGDVQDGSIRLLEIGCGVGNLIFPLIEENKVDYFIYACDFSPRAIEFVKQNPLYNESKIIAFQCDVTTDSIFNYIKDCTLDIITVIFVLSAILPKYHEGVFKTLYKLLKPGGKVLFRDYGLYDMAQIRFKPGHKIAENLYMRQDGTRSYFFSEDELSTLVGKCGFQIIENNYVYRRTINPKENINVERIFLQGKFMKPF
jgi:methyltransferase-like protein 6